MGVIPFYIINFSKGRVCYLILDVRISLFLLDQEVNQLNVFMIYSIMQDSVAKL